MSKEEVSLIIESFISNESKLYDFKHLLVTNRLEALSFLAGVLSLIVAIFAAIVGNSEVSYLSLFAFFGFLVIYALSSFISTVKFFVSATHETLKSINEKHESEYPIATKISAFSTDSIDHVIALFEYRIRYLESRVGFLVGFVDKLGIVPAVIMLYLAYVKAVDSHSALDLPPFVIGIVSGVYLGAISARIVIDSLRDKIAILEYSKAISKKRNRFKLP